MARHRPLFAFTATAALAVLAAAGARAQVGPTQVTGPPLPLFTTTTTTRPGPTTTAPRGGRTTTTQPSGNPPLLTLPGQSPPSGPATTTTTRPAGARAPGPAPGTPSGAAPPAPPQPPPPPEVAAGGGDATGAATGPLVIPPDIQKIIDSVIRTKPNNTAALIDVLSALEDFGLTAQEAYILGMGHFPVAGFAGWSDDWLYPRVGPPFHLHQGNDIFAPAGTPVRAPYDGVVRYTTNRLGGLAAYLTMDDGTYFYNAHLSATVQNLATGTRVKQGTVIGFVGNSGNAATTPSHDHFEIHPQGGGAVDPKPFLDQWVAEALANVPALVDRFRASQPKALIATGLTRRLGNGTGDVFAGLTHPPRGQLLWASSMSPAGGVLRLAEVEATKAAEDIDWLARARDDTVRAVTWQQATTYARALLNPLTPAVIAGAFE